MTEEVWAVWPTVHLEQSKKMVKIWKDRGYKTAVLVNPPHDPAATGCDKGIVQKKWMGFPTAANLLCRSVPGDVVVVVGDDVYPSEDFTAQELLDHFLEEFPDTFGLVQPIGDDFAFTDKCAVSPWIGREFIRKAYNGDDGPFHKGYFHYYSDYELQEVAKRLECFVQWENVKQFHDHWQREEKPKRPKHLLLAEKKHGKDQQLHSKRKRRGYPGLMRKPVGSKRVDQQGSAWKEWRRGFAKNRDARESASGHGSSLENTKEIREALPGILKKYSVRVLTDVPCGDWNWMSKVDLSGVDYLGLDVVPSQIRENKQRFPIHAFQAFNLLTDIPRCSDLILCRDLLFHLPDDMIHTALENLKASGSRLLLTTNFSQLGRNKDLILGIKVGWRQVNLQAPPFKLPIPMETIQENHSDACRGRVVSLYDMEDM